MPCITLTGWRKVKLIFRIVYKTICRVQPTICLSVCLSVCLSACQLVILCLLCISWANRRILKLLNRNVIITSTCIMFCPKSSLRLSVFTAFISKWLLYLKDFRSFLNNYFSMWSFFPYFYMCIVFWSVVCIRSQCLWRK